MKLLKLLPFLALLAVSACSKVPAGNVGIKVYLLGSSKGVDTEELGVGRYWIGINEDLYLFPTYQQNYTWTKSPHEGQPVDESFTFQTKEGLSVNADVGITYSLDAKKVPLVFQKYRRGIEEITDTFLRNHVRDALNSVSSTMGVEDVYGTGKVKMMVEVQRAVDQEVGPIGINIEKIYLIGDMRLPANVVGALNSKIEATQRAQQRENELREAEAQAKKDVAQAEGEAGKQLALAQGRAKSVTVEAEAQAKANKILSESLTPGLIEYQKINKWNGVLPQFAGGGVPLINIGAKQ